MWRMLQIAGATAVLAVSMAGAKTTFRESTVHGPGEQALFCDLDGDRLKDIVLPDEPNLLIFYQDAGKGFAEKPDQVCRLGDKPAVFWPARLNSEAESLLVMTCDGVTEWAFTNRSGPVVRRQIITGPAVLPESAEGPSLAYFPLSPRASGNVPVILVPVGRDLQVWRRTDAWRHEQTLEKTLETSIWTSREDLGYDKGARLTLSHGDFTGDGRDDLLLRTRFVPTCRYAMYARQDNGLFSPDPVLTWSGKQDWSWHAWVDIDRDGRVDLIDNTWLSDPWFLPGTRSGKVLVRIHLADKQGQIPTEPTQIFRKNDWIDSIPVVDIDGDGRLDLVLGYSAFDSREGFRKAFTAKQIDFTLRFHFGRTDGRFPEEADCSRDLLIRIDRPSIDLTSPRRWYFETFVNLLGDFDGDGDRDLLVRDLADRVSVYPFVSRQAGFARNAEMGFRYTDPIDRLQVEDLNEDGISDLVMKISEKEVFRVFLSRIR